MKLHGSPDAKPAELDAELKRIRAWARANDLKPATVARLAGIAEKVTRDLYDAQWSPTSRSIRAMETLIPSGWKPGDPVPAQAVPEDAAGADRRRGETFPPSEAA